MNPVQTFLRKHYSDARLVELLQHCQDGKFAFRSCCCFIGIATADHELQGFTEKLPDNWPAHLEIARELPGAPAAEDFIFRLENDTERRAYLIPLIEAEIAYRGARNVEDSLSPAVADSVGDSGSLLRQSVGQEA